jgi:hypothetical protein
MAPTAPGALLRVSGPNGGTSIEISITLTASGPVLRARAAALEIEADTDLVARCRRFRVEARESLELIAGGTLLAEGRRVTVEATHGSARVHANDDVQLLGENVLLNCERSPPMPPWVGLAPAMPRPALPVEDVSGDAKIALELRPET